MFRYIIYILLFAAILSCGGKNDNVQQKKQEATNQNTHYDLDEIEESGEIIAVTMYGRNTYTIITVKKLVSPMKCFKISEKAKAWA